MFPGGRGGLRRSSEADHGRRCRLRTPLAVARLVRHLESRDGRVSLPAERPDADVPEVAEPEVRRAGPRVRRRRDFDERDAETFVEEYRRPTLGVRSSESSSRNETQSWTSPRTNGSKSSPGRKDTRGLKSRDLPRRQSGSSLLMAPSRNLSKSPTGRFRRHSKRINHPRNRTEYQRMENEALLEITAVDMLTEEQRERRDRLLEGDAELGGPE